MLIFGSRVTLTVVLTLVMACETCGNTAAHHLARRARKFTLFFIPVLPLGSSYQDTCTACGRVVGVPKDQAQAALERQGR